MMNQSELRTEWIRRLRSGDYNQTRSYLNRDGKFCCLGVACEILVEEGILTLTPGHFADYDDSTSLMPTRGVKALGLCTNNGDTKSGDSGSLTYLNNKSGKTFDEIADALETGDYWL